jgi:prepilin-type processing-associated H-X9-DG protein
MKTRKGKQEKGNKTTGAYLDGHAAQQKPMEQPTPAKRPSPEYLFV